jgi:hypothetical protein
MFDKRRSRNLLYLAILISLILGCLLNQSKQQPTAKPTYSGGQPDGIPVGGWGEWKYVYEPSLLPLPPEATVENAHGIVMDDDGQLVITYQDSLDSSRCLLRWKSQQYDKIPEFLGPGKSLCAGVPHGLRADTEKDANSGKERMVLYHANNEQVLHKTTMDGEILWSVQGNPEKKGAYRPTWLAADPNSLYVYLADGYGSSKVFVLYKSNGTYTGQSFGGLGSEHGKFQTDHAITWDWRRNQMLVTDRENHRLEYFRVDANDPSVFEYTNTISYAPMLQRPCNIRPRKEDGTAIIPFLEGLVGIVDKNNDLFSVINITNVLGDRGFLHPHDAHFVPDGSGDFVLVTWNPGRIGFFRRVPEQDEVEVSQQ